ncbi:MAG TPA: carboxypeptidase-like regulatory domain-containing protein, partial [Gemmatimonadaceae bacterium]|nr:carboxypeptidase-like regulatory domain-containing protein [Gemmatimonadaceae bacterium]
MSQSKRLLGVTLFAAAMCVGCESPTRAPQLDLQGLRQSTPTDSAGSPVPPGSSEATPGYIRGVVRSSELKQPTGPDTLVNSVRLAGVRVVALPVTDLTKLPPTTGAAAAEVTTNANGEFTLPQLPGGPYVVTFTPPAGSDYQGVWTVATID